jgi:hypothetical protein
LGDHRGVGGGQGGPWADAMFVLVSWIELDSLIAICHS